MGGVKTIYFVIVIRYMDFIFSCKRGIENGRWRTNDMCLGQQRNYILWTNQ